MSRRARHHPAATRRADHQPPPAALAESPKIVSNPIFRCEAGPKPSQSKPPPPGDHRRCIYRPGSLYALVHDPAAGGDGIGKPLPLPLPPCRAHRAGSHVPTLQVGPALVAGSPRQHGRVLRKALPQDPFLAAYVACSKSDKDDAVGVERRQQKQRKGRKKKTTKAKKKKEGEEVVRGCGVWSGWAAGAKYAGAMSCRHGCAVAEQKQGDAPAAAGKKEAGEEDAAAGLTLDLSWAARALERRREQR